ncbi:MAG TPA: methyl-accepting chemotaxis protein, partial [Pseudomonas sp.]|nr:methyl-accepting chemotaxis protein [Pseudomonas sp.]
MSLRNMNIAPRALLGFALIGALMLALGIFALTQMSKIREAGQSIEQVTVPSIKALDQINLLTLRLRTLSYRLMINREADVVENSYSQLTERNNQIDAARKIYEPLIAADEERAVYNQFVQVLGQYRQLENRMVELSRSNNLPAIRELINRDLLQTMEQITTAMDKLVKINTEQTRDINHAAAEQYSTAFTLVIALLVAATVLTFFCAILLTRSIVKPMNEVLGVAEQIAAGNLTHSIRPEGSDEAARLQQAMAKMQEQLRDTLQQISGSATQLASAAEELNSVTEESARGLQQQNNEIEQAATAVTEMTSAVEEVARNAVSTSEASAEATRSATDGRDLVLETVSAIERMSNDVQSTSVLVGNLAEQSRD